ncbi:MAG: spermidine synthase [Sulfurimonas sp.]|nr:spermidine synthase [Sulfurimonas sp.]
MKSFIYPEMMVHVALCTNKVPENVLIISNNAELLMDEMKKYGEVSSKVIGCSMDELREEADASYDVVISEMYGDNVVLAHINRILKADGQLVINNKPLEDVDSNKVLMQDLANYFKIIMPYNLGNDNSAILASKEYHPTADIILQRADMLDNLNYYNTEIHLASFAMPNYIRKEYLGIIKN